MIYLDNAATTKISTEVLDAMIPYLTSFYGNAGTLYNFGRQSYKAIESARKSVAKVINAKPSQIVFTSGASEANSSVFRGIKDELISKGKTEILVSAVEHDSVWKAAESLTTDGFTIKYIPVQKDCVVNIEDVNKLVTPKTGIISIMGVNNETGAINPIKEMADLCNKSGIYFHTDCVQALGQIELNVQKMKCDFLTISSHKIHGPKGMGALYVRNPDSFVPMILGGADQEYGIRGGTENVAGIVGFGSACGNLNNSHSLRDKKRNFYSALLQGLDNRHIQTDIVKINGSLDKTADKILNITIEGVDSETLLLMLDSKDVCISAGSACRSRESEPSRTLIAMGLTPEEARCSVRISFSYMNSNEEVLIAAEEMAECISILKGCGDGDVV